MSMNDPQPIGDRIRALLDPALDDPRKTPTQLEIIDAAFFQIAERIERSLEMAYTAIFNQAAKIEQRNPDQRNIFIVEQITAINPQTGEAKYNPILKMGLPISTAFTEFSPNDIKELPGYIALHEKARDMNVALRLYSLTADEKQPGSLNNQAVLVIDGAKSYADGALENAQLYPNLPEKPVEFNPKRAGSFKL